jgi:hypothetical protein
MKLSLSKAAQETGKSKPTISKAIKTGRLSAKKVGVGYEIDPAELFRVYPKATDTLPVKDVGVSPSVSALETEVRMLREAIDREKEISDDYRARLDRAELLIADQRPPQKTRWFWQRGEGGL